MIVFIQALVIIVALVIILSVFVGKQTHLARAWKKIVLCLLAATMIVVVLFPEITNIAAGMVGVGRGADLLLYILTLVFIGYVINNYLLQQKEREVIHKLARRIALQDAKAEYGQQSKGKKP